MKLSEIFEHLTYGELSLLKIGGLDATGIEQENYGQIISFINMGLTSLYQTFLLLEKNVTIELFEHITEYELTYEHAQSNPADIDLYVTRYIADTGYGDTFTEDVLQIHSAYDKNFEELPINDLNERTSIFTVADNIVQVPYPGQGTFIDLIYHAYPKKIPLTLTNPSLEEVRLPLQLLPALTAYVGYRAHIALPDGDNSKSNGYLARYRGMLKDTILLGTLNKPNLGNLKLKANGWK